jgi:murein DD-endopeptidase MepM/ murein hydrolase activator NlpD
MAERAARVRVGWLERFGLRPLGPALRQARKAVLGNAATPATLWDRSSLRIFKPSISLPTWLGRTRGDGLVPVYNFFNREQPPSDAAYSVRVSFCRDFQGGQWTYDSHVGTDFAVPVGTPVVATAPGRVLRVASELDHGGLKVCIDHGQGLFTTSSHLSRAFVQEGDFVGRGSELGISGASGIEFVLFFPWVAPHLHLNVWLGGEPVDPFAVDGEPSLWRRHNDPRPFEGDAAADEAFEPSEWDARGVEEAIAACRDVEVRERARSFPTLERRAAEILFHRVLSSAAFDAFPPLYARCGARRPVLDLPFAPADFRGAWLPPRTGHTRRVEGGAP